MSLPVVEQIARKLAARVARVTQANGCSFDALVVRPNRGGAPFVPLDRQVAVLQGEGEEDGANSTEGMPRLVARWLTFEVFVFVITSDKDATPSDTYANIRLAEVQRTIATPETPGEDWVKFDGLAVNAELGDPTDIPTEDGRFAGPLLPVRVLYRTPENDPFTVA